MTKLSKEQKRVVNHMAQGHTLTRWNHWGHECYFSINAPWPENRVRSSTVYGLENKSVIEVISGNWTDRHTNYRLTQLGRELAK